MPALMPASDVVATTKYLHLPAEQRSQRRCTAAIGYMNHIDASHHLEQLSSQMFRSTVASRRKVEFARIGLGVSDELGDGLGGDRWVDDQDQGQTDQSGDRRDVANEIEIQFFVERRIDRIRRRADEERIAVRCRSDDGLGRDVVASSGAVLNDELLAEVLQQPLAHETCIDVGGTTGRKADDQMNWP
jgi:hypothetical protein